MQPLSSEGRRALDTMAQRHGVPPEAALTALQAVAAGGGTMAQFSHPDLGGMGQWTAGGMIMIGDMFNHGLKQRVAALCADLAALLHEPGLFAPQPPGKGGDEAGQWWPAGLGVAAASGAQNDLRYAYFPASRRLAVLQDGHMRQYDTGEHQIGGVSQQQGGAQSLVFASQHGPVHLENLRRVDMSAPRAAEPRAAPEDPFAHIERLADLHQRGVVSDAEFAAKKAELLRRI